MWKARGSEDCYTFFVQICLQMVKKIIVIYSKTQKRTTGRTQYFVNGDIYMYSRGTVHLVEEQYTWRWETAYMVKMIVQIHCYHYVELWIFGSIERNYVLYLFMLIFTFYEYIWMFVLMLWYLVLNTYSYMQAWNCCYHIFVWLVIILCCTKSLGLFRLIKTSSLVNFTLLHLYSLVI